MKDPLQGTRGPLEPRSPVPAASPRDAAPPRAGSSPGQAAPLRTRRGRCSASFLQARGSRGPGSCSCLSLTVWRPHWLLFHPDLPPTPGAAMTCSAWGTPEARSWGHALGPWLPTVRSPWAHEGCVVGASALYLPSFPYFLLVWCFSLISIFYTDLWEPVLFMFSAS